MVVEDGIFSRIVVSLLGFNVGSVADNREKYQINRDVCSVPGFLTLDKLLPKHIDIPEIYHLVIALLLGHPVSGE